MERTALLSPCGRYRYRLSRRWAQGPSALWIMLNPSTADDRRDDPTIRRCIGFSRAWGFGAMEVVNLFALRTPHTRTLAAAAHPVGADNDRHICDASSQATLIIAAWGAWAAARGRDHEVLGLLHQPLWCLGRTASGSPRHPLYLPRRSRRRPFSGETPYSPRSLKKRLISNRTSSGLPSAPVASMTS
ncbi:MAG: DUF1643 domain-containing protein [Phycisphaerales bacterium]